MDQMSDVMAWGGIMSPDHTAIGTLGRPSITRHLLLALEGADVTG